MADQTVKSTNITAVESRVTLQDRTKRGGHRGGVLWFTGLSGSGKSTLAIELERRLFNIGYNVYVLDGDNVRHGLSSNLGFSPEDRTENIRRIGEVSALFANAGFIVIAAFISPYQADRDRAREAAGVLRGEGERPSCGTKYRNGSSFMLNRSTSAFRGMSIPQAIREATG